MQPNLGPDHDLALRLTTLESNVAALQTRDVLQNASIGVGGLTVNGGTITITGGGSLVIQGTGTFTTNGNISTTGAFSASTTITAGTNITAIGTVTGATVTSTGELNGVDVILSGSVYSLHGRNTPVTSGYVAAYFNSDGRLGASASSLQFKQDIEPADTSAEVDALMHVALIRFRYIADVEAHGDAAPWHLGSIAEYMQQTALAEWVPLDADGNAFAINWEQMGIPIIAALQALNARLTKAGF